ncbi:4-hydroxy-3-methylbut-2-enyl diphosphate reductase [Mordavella massiliensis]|uniref:4-hydroxy-3-methylbut-2-enyl diphosphate reductase n=1 Tax=Mordavella massiliensis TaxID=1871024 RepID=A0A939BG06_9CLOT|nr:4-hydroxy-3-methylbut-2-enyl diphosphate reductase [Mordavella massiliensis]MBM6948907.1 4-hydroxy-3-methylbut-2-enyl diphosphate reductase [Mordavella massiliensis]
MEVQAITPRGYCKGVVRAIDMARKARNAKQPVVILGMIVHNQYIVDALEKMGIRTVDHPDRTRLELLDEIEEGTVIITAHGAGEQVFAKAREKGLHVIDASCLDVIKTHDLIRARLRDGFEILYIGKKGHPEAEGAVSIDEEKVHLISGREDFGTLDPNKRYVITNQTTMSLYDVQDLCDYARQTLAHVTVEKETCAATKVRQEAIRHMDRDVDIAFIVGDPRSNNTRKLASIASDGREVHMIGSLDDLDVSVLRGKRKAAVSSGASTPPYLTDQVIAFLEQYDGEDPSTWEKPAVDLTRILEL